jgi:hypothetical protein
MMPALWQPQDARLLAAPGQTGERATIEPLPDSAAAPRSAPFSSSAQQSFSGRLTVVWGDGEPGSDETKTIFRLVTDEGAALSILPGLVTEGELLAFDGRYVIVNGSSAERKSTQAAELLALRVHSIQINKGKENSGREQQLTGSQPWVSILCKFADIGVEERPLSYFQNMYGNTYPALDHYWRELSYNQINLSGSAAYGWFTLPHPRSYYVYDMDGDGQVDANLEALANDCTAVADTAVYFPSFVGINLMFNADLACCAWGGSIYLDLDGQNKARRTTWLPEWSWLLNLFTIEHEMGHGFGLPHSSGQYGKTYDNKWDVMSGYIYVDNPDPTYGALLGQHTISYHKESLGWIAPDTIVTVAAGTKTTISLEQLALPQTANYKMVKIPAGDSDSTFYTLEVRRRVGHDIALPGQGVIIHEVDTTRIRPAQVIDSDGNGNTGDDGAIWSVGETFVDTQYGIKVTVDAATDTGYVITIEVDAPPIFIDCATQAELPAAECDALTTLYNTTSGVDWTNNNGWLAFASPCNWFGISCEAGHVVSIDLHNNRLNGRIPAELGALSNLADLRLHRNQLSGSMPNELGDLSNLVSLDLSYNGLDGEISPQFANLANLGFGALNLGYNKLFASDQALIIFLQDRDPDWNLTQTVAPANLHTVVHVDSLQLFWDAIPFVGGNGAYEISYATSRGGPYTIYGTTDHKQIVEYLITDLAPDTTYYVVIRTFTEAYEPQQNDLWSAYSEEASATTPTAVWPGAYLPLISR